MVIVAWRSSNLVFFWKVRVYRKADFLRANGSTPSHSFKENLPCLWYLDFLPSFKFYVGVL